jgi:hypothetical protein
VHAAVCAGRRPAARLAVCVPCGCGEVSAGPGPWALGLLPPPGSVCDVVRVGGVGRRACVRAWSLARTSRSSAHVPMRAHTAPIDISMYMTWLGMVWLGVVRGSVGPGRHNFTVNVTTLAGPKPPLMWTWEVVPTFIDATSEQAFGPASTALFIPLVASEPAVDPVSGLPLPSNRATVSFRPPVRPRKDEVRGGHLCLLAPVCCAVPHLHSRQPLPPCVPARCARGWNVRRQSPTHGFVHKACPSRHNLNRTCLWVVCTCVWATQPGANHLLHSPGPRHSVPRNCHGDRRGLRRVQRGRDPSARRDHRCQAVLQQRRARRAVAVSVPPPPRHPLPCTRTPVTRRGRCVPSGCRVCV